MREKFTFYCTFFSFRFNYKSIPACYNNSQLNLLSKVVEAQYSHVTQYDIKLCWPVARVFNYISKIYIIVLLLLSSIRFPCI